MMKMTPHTFSLVAALFVVGLAMATADGVFDVIDKNHDGSISKSEYAEGLKKLEAFLQKPLPASSSGGGFLEFNLVGFWKAFTSSLAMIIATEIGDKTFFIAAVLSMKHSRSAVFAGAILALIIMTILSTAMGLVLPNIMPRKYTHVLGGFLFLYFGCKLIYDSQQMEQGRVSDELEEVEESLLQQSNKKEEDEEGGRSMSQNSSNNNGSKTGWYPIALQSLTLTFLAEWGDRSQIATIALAAAKNPVGVTIGGCLGHSLCTGLAVVGGRMLAARISEKTVTLGGGCVFIIFGLHSLFFEE